MTTVLTVEYADSYGVSIQGATRDGIDLDRYAGWAKPLIMRAVGGGAILEMLGIADMPDRISDGMFDGCTNRVWTVSAVEVDQMVRLNEERAAARIARQIAEGCEPQTTPTCPRCGTYCYGDCTASQE